MILPVVYALFALFSVKNDLDHGGELHFMRLLILATGYAIGSGVLLIAQFSTTGLVFVIGCFALSCLTIYLMDGKYADRHNMSYAAPLDDEYQDDQAQDYRAQQSQNYQYHDRFADLNLNFMKEHAEARRMHNRRTRTFPRWTAVLAVAYFAVVIPADVYFMVVVPEEADKLLRTAPLIKADQLANYVGSKKPVAIEGFTGPSFVRNQKIAFERVYGYSRHYRRRRGTTFSWDELMRYPSGLIITSGTAKTKVMVDGYNTNAAFLDGIFLGHGTDLSQAPMPPNWPAELLQDIKHPKVKRFIAKGLPSNHAVTVIGTVDLASNYEIDNNAAAKYIITALKYKGDNYDAVATTMPYAKLKEFLHDFSAVKPYTGSFPGENTTITQTAGQEHRQIPDDWLYNGDYYEYQ